MSYRCGVVTAFGKMVSRRCILQVGKTSRTLKVFTLHQLQVCSITVVIQMQTGVIAMIIPWLSMLNILLKKANKYVWWKLHYQSLSVIVYKLIVLSNTFVLVDICMLCWSVLWRGHNFEKKKTLWNIQFPMWLYSLPAKMARSDNSLLNEWGKIYFNLKNSTTLPTFIIPISTLISLLVAKANLNKFWTDFYFIYWIAQ